MTMNELIMKAREKKCSDIHISEGMPVSFRIHGQLLDSGFSFPAAETREMILSMLSDEQREQLENGDDVDFAIETPDYCRQRVNVFRQMKKVAATIRLLNNTIPTLEQLQMPKVLRELADQPRGLILVTGPTGSGKSTTLSAMIDYINKNRSEHIITIEDPVEYVYESGMSVIHQREIGVDTKSFAASLRSALREDPDVMHTLNADLARLVRAGTIRRDDAIRVSNNKNEILDLLS